MQSSISLIGPYRFKGQERKTLLSALVCTNTTNTKNDGKMCVN